MAKVVVRSLLSAVCIVVADASSFLGAKEKQEISSDEVVDTLQSLLASTRSLELKKVEDDLRPMFVALPKNDHGSLDHATVRYALHRYFVQKHGWYMNGLDPAQGGWNMKASTLMKDRAPSFIQDVLEKRLHGEGLGLHDLAVFVATLSSLVQQETSAALHSIFEGLGVPLTGHIGQKTADVVLKNYVMRDMLDLADEDVNTSVDLSEFDMREFYPSWDDLSMWLEDYRLEREHMRVRNPFVQLQESFQSSAEFVQDMTYNFGRFQSLECMSLKASLVDMDRQGAGRVLLRDFYSSFQNDPLHHFSESVDYLRNLGALDERDPKRMSVVIPNYIISKTNCLATSGFYSVCCSNECEGLMRHLEQNIAGPSGSPARIADLISSLPSDTVDAPRNLSSALHGRLEEIASYHGGEVPLYGRLFSQWMHHAYPRECPFPHISGTTSPLSAEQWMAEHESDEASKEEVEKYLAMAHEHDGAAELPWTAVEELVVDYVKPSSTSSVFSALRGFFFLSGIVSFAVPLVQTMKTACEKEETHLV